MSTVFCLFFVLLFFSCEKEIQQNSAKKLPTPPNCIHDSLDQKAIPELISILENRLEAIEHPTEDSCYVNLLNQTSIAYYYDEDLDNALNYGQKAVDFVKAHLDKHDSRYIAAFGNMGLYYGDKNDFEKAFYYNEKCLELDKSKVPIDYLSLGISYNSLGHIDRAIGDLENASNYFAQAVDALNNMKPDDQLKASPPFLLDFAKNTYLKGEYKKATKQFDNCLNYISSIEPDSVRNHKWIQQIELNCFQNLAEIALISENHDRADKHLHKALAIQDSFDKMFLDYYTHQILGDKALILKNYEKALLHYNDAEVMLLEELQGNTKDAQVARLLTSKAKVTQSIKGGEKESLQIHQKALHSLCIDFNSKNIYSNPQMEDIFDKYTAIEILTNKANGLKRFDKDREKTLQAIHECYHLINQLISQVRSSFRDEKSKFILSERMIQIYENAIENAMKRYQLTKNDTFLHDAYGFAAAGKAAALREKIQQHTAESEAIIPDDIKDELYELKVDIDFKTGKIYESELRETPDQIKIAALKKQRNGLKESLNAIFKNLEKDYPDYYQLKIENKIPTVKEIQNHLKADELLFEYFVGIDKVYLFGFSKKDLQVFEIPLKVEQFEILSTLKQQLNTYPTHPDFKIFRENALSLYQDFVAIGLSKLGQGKKQLTIIPDGILHGLSFESLLTNSKEELPKQKYSIKNLSYLLEEFAITYHYAASIMIHSSRKKPKNTSYQFLGICPVKDLNYAAEEVTGIFDILDKNGKLLMYQDANYQNLENQIEDAQLIHFATHAKPNNEHPELNQIDLYGNKKMRNAKIESLPLKADLVVLSACSSGAGKNLNGEGVMSLARSLQVAGAPSVVASLWQVNDAATSNIMTSFYQELKNSQSKSSALQIAKLDYLKQNEFNSLKSHPYFWSPFIQIGNGNPIEF